MALRRRWLMRPAILRHMPTKARDVPWPEVADLSDDLFEWFVKHQKLPAKVARQRGRLELCADFLAKDGVEETLPYRIVSAIVDLERYRGAGRRAELSKTEQRLTAQQRQVLVDDSLERRADNAIRALRPRLAEIRRLILQVGERNDQRNALFPWTPSVVAANRRTNQTALARVRREVDAMTGSAESLRDSFAAFNPAATDEPLTLAGWHRLKRRIQKDLLAAGFPRAL
jgi:hypothetical protein